MDDSTFASSGDAAEFSADDMHDDSIRKGSSRRLILAGMGAMATACDSAEERFDRFVDRGQQVREDWNSRATDFRRQNASTRGRMRDYFRSTMDIFLSGLSVPSKADVDTINAKLNILNRKMDDIQLDRAGGTATTASEPTPAPPLGPGETAT